jgi:ribosomal protein S12 methylthiotransferase accessory factor YcaO
MVAIKSVPVGTHDADAVALAEAVREVLQQRHLRCGVTVFPSTLPAGSCMW